MELWVASTLLPNSPTYNRSLMSNKRAIVNVLRGMIGIVESDAEIPPRIQQVIEESDFQLRRYVDGNSKNR